MISKGNLPAKYNLCAVVTSYNPGPGFEERISQISKQVDCIVIIDNNSDKQILKLHHELSTKYKLQIIYNTYNLGVATALNQGINWAKLNNYSWVILFDQDTSISESLIDTLCSTYQKIGDGEQVGIIGPNYKTFQSASTVTHGFRTVRSIITSGSLIPLSLFEKIGLFREELFIDFVDIEFCLRAGKKGFKIIRVNEHLMSHSVGTVTTHKLLWKTTVTTNHSHLRRYYMMRNNIVVVKDYFHFYPGWAINSLFVRLKSTLRMLFFEEGKLIKFKFSMLGLIDGISGRFNRFSCETTHLQPLI